jgi:hypothetical protein
LTAAAPNGDEQVSIDDPAAAVARIRSLSASAPGMAAVDLSGSRNVIPILLEALPRWGRLMLAADCSEPFATEFYTDIHRKGALVCSGADLSSMLVNASLWAVEARNACRLLLDPKRAATLRGCVHRERA